ncbi:MAG: hypothetical protein CL609_09805 [Anaerolineaceae bacterium]|nr:hypothetical protein [Anaerolineaceae bacterium]
MKKKLSIISIFILLTMVLSAVWMPVQAQDSVDNLQLVLQDGVLEWQTGWKDQVSNLTIGYPDNRTTELTFTDGKAVQFDTTTLKDGVYTFRLVGFPLADYELLSQAALSEDGRDRILTNLSDLETHIWSGSFSVLDGIIYLPEAEDLSEETSIGIKDVVTADDAIITGSLCVGFDCVNGESFGFDTIRLKENNLRIRFLDTSNSAGFPTTDWQITINDSNSGGASYFAIDDIDGGRTPFKIEANAPSNSLYIEDYGRIGFGTNNPVVELHIADGDTPTVRLDQDGTSGWSPQVWDVAGNESNFFIRDATNGSKLPFRIQPSAPSSSLTIKNTGNIGFGTWLPETSLHIFDLDSAPTIRFDNGTYAWNVSGSASGFVVNDGTTDKNPFQILTGAESDSLVISTDGKVGIGTQAPQAELHVEGDAFVNGDIVLEGYISERSDVAAKENFKVVSGRQILDRLAELPITTWNYKGDASTLHIGPMAQDFYGSYGVGKDDKHLSALDVNGVALASIQELNRIVEEKDAQIANLEADLSSLNKRVQQLETGQSGSTLNLVLPFVFGLGGMVLGALFLSKRR